MKKITKKLELNKTSVNQLSETGVKGGWPQGETWLSACCVKTEDVNCYSFKGSVLACPTWACPQN